MNGRGRSWRIVREEREGKIERNCWRTSGEERAFRVSSEAVYHPWENVKQANDMNQASGGRSGLWGMGGGEREGKNRLSEGLQRLFIVPARTLNKRSY